MERRFRRTLSTLIALVLLGATGCNSEPSGPERVELAGEGVWDRLPQGPLSARRGVHAFWVDGEIYVMGGTRAPACPPTADCVAPEVASERDGAAFDPRTETWRELADAPLPLGQGSGVVMGRSIYLLLWGGASTHPSEDRAFVAYDTSKDEWRELPFPPGNKDAFRRITPGADGPIAFNTSQENGFAPDLVFDPAEDEWARLPRDPLVPSFDRSLVSTPQGIVAIGIESVPNPGVEPAVYRAAVLRNGRWVRVVESRVVGWDPMWALIDGAVTNVSLGTIDGGETNPFPRPFQTGGIFDPRTMTWRPLPNRPFDGEPWEPGVQGLMSGVYAYDARWGLGGQGYAFDSHARRWYAVVHPPSGVESELGATWTDAGLVVAGGVSWNGSKDVVYDDAWIWTPPND